MITSSYYFVCICCVLSRVQLFVTPCTVTCYPPSVHGKFQAKIVEWVALGIELASLMSPEWAGRFFTTSAPWEAPNHLHLTLKYEIKE